MLQWCLVHGVFNNVETTIDIIQWTILNEYIPINLLNIEYIKTFFSFSVLLYSAGYLITTNNNKARIVLEIPEI